MRRFVPSGGPAASDPDFNEAGWEDAIWQEEQRQEAEAAILLRIPLQTKTRLTIEAGKRTAATGKRVSVNSLIKEMVDDALERLDKADSKAD